MKKSFYSTKGKSILFCLINACILLTMLSSSKYKEFESLATPRASEVRNIFFKSFPLHFPVLRHGTTLFASSTIISEIKPEYFELKSERKPHCPQLGVSESLNIKYLIIQSINQLIQRIMKKNFLLLMMALLFSFGVHAQLQVQIGNGTDGTYQFPSNTLYNYSFTEQIYLASEIGAAGTIQKIGFYYKGGDYAVNRDVVVYMRHVNKTSFANVNDYVAVAAADVVFTGMFTGPTSEGWIDITLDTPFSYNGTDNLLIAFDDNTGAWSSRYFRYTTSTDRGLCYYSDGHNPDPMDLSAFSGSKIKSSNRSNLRLTIAVGDAPLIVVTPDPVGPYVSAMNRPNGYWMRPFTVNVANEGLNANIRSIDVANNPSGYFILEDMEFPFVLNYGEDIDVSITTGSTEEGLVESHFVVSYEANRVVDIYDMRTNAYNAISPDVFELARVVSAFPYTDTPEFGALYDNYLLPGDTEDTVRRDAVYKLTVTSDMVLNGNIEGGESPLMAIYTEDFNGEPGPGPTNNYTGPTNASGGGVGTNLTYGFEDDPIANGWVIIANNATTWNRVGTVSFSSGDVVPHEGSYQMNCHWSWGDQDEWLVSPAFTVPADANLTFWMYGHYGSTHGDHYYVKISTDNGSTWTELWDASAQPEANNHYDEAVNVSLGAYSGQNVKLAWQAIGTGGIWHSWFIDDITIGSRGEVLTFNGTQVLRQPVNRIVTDVRDSAVKGGRGTREVLFTDGGEGHGADNTHTGLTVREGDIVFEESFDGCAIPDGWTLIDADNDGRNWEPTCGIYNTSTHTGAGALFSRSWTAGRPDLNPDNYVVTPRITIPVNGQLKYWISSQSPWGNEHYGVFVSTTGTSPADFTKLFEETLPENGRGSDNLDNGQVSVTNRDKGEMVEKSERNSRLPYDYKERTVDLSAYAGQDVYIAFRHYESEGIFRLYLDDVTVTGSNAPTPPAPVDYLLENIVLTPGTYYVVAAAKTAFTVNLEAEILPCPEQAVCVYPMDNAGDITSPVTLQWQLDPYATEYRLVFGTTYFCEDVLVDWTSNLANSYTVSGLYNNTNYFWRVDQRNHGACEEGVLGKVWGFTTTFNVPQNLRTATPHIYEGDDLVLTWDPIVDRTFRQYNIYQDGELIGHTATNGGTNIVTYTVENLSYNIGGYDFNVTALYDEGESGFSNTLNVPVSGEGEVNGHVYEQDGETGIADATVKFVGEDEFGVARTFSFTTNDQGYYSGVLLAGEYSGKASCEGYQEVAYSDNPVVIIYEETTEDIDFIMDENFNPVAQVIAEYYPDPENPESPYVKVYWSWNIMQGQNIIEDFETGDFSSYDWNNDATYPWTIVTTNPYEGTYCMKSGGSGVDNAVSSISVTVEIPRNGLMSFYGKISSETNWDFGYFYIDGQQMGKYSGAGSWAEYEFAITEGSHTFQWKYQKDFMVSANDDCFYVDYISFYHDPEPVSPGWIYYDNGTNENAIGLSEGGSFYWGICFPDMSQYTGYSLTKASLYDNTAHTGKVMIYQGGTTAPGTLVYQQPYTCTGSEDFVEIALTTPVTIDPAQSLWIVMNNNDGQYVASCCANTGNPNGRWISLDGTEWSDVASFGLEYTWMIRGYVANGSGDMALSAPAVSNSTSTVDAVLRTPVLRNENAKLALAGLKTPHNVGVPAPNVTPRGIDRSFQYFRVYRTDCYNTEYTPENTVVLACELQDTLYIDVSWPNTAPGVYKWGVGCVYAGNRESEIRWAEPTRNVTAEVSGMEPMQLDENRAPWDLMANFTASTAAQYGIASDGTNIYMCNWGYSGISDKFFKYDMEGNFIEGFSIAGCGTIRDLDYDGQYFYGGANSNKLYCIDLANKQLVSTTTTACSKIRHCSYDPVNDGFWVGGWDDLMLISRAGALIQNGPAVSSCGGTGYYTAEDGSAHLYLYCEPTDVIDFDIATNTVGSVIYNTNTIPGYNGYGTVGGCFIGQYNGKVAFYATLQQDPNIVGIYELREGSQPTPGGNGLQEPRESPIVWSNCLDKDMFIGGEDGKVEVTVLLNSSDNPVGTTVSLENLNEFENELGYNYDVTLDSTGHYAWNEFRRGSYAVEVAHAGYETVRDTVTVDGPQDLRYVLIEILYNVGDLYVSRTGWAMWEGMGTVPTPPGTEFTFGFEEDLAANGWTIQSHNSTTWERTQTTGFGAVPHEGEWQMHLYWSWGDQDEWLITPEFVVPAQGNLNFWMYGFLGSTNGDHYYVKISTDGGGTWTELWDASAQSGGQNHYDSAIDVDLSAYAGQSVKLAWQGLATGGLWYAWCIDDITVSGGREVLSFDGRKWYRKAVVATEPSGPDQFGKDGSGGMAENRHLEFYKVLCTSIDGEPIFNVNTERNFCQVATESLVPGDTYICKVAAVYSTGMSAWETVEWQYQDCADYEGVVNDQVTGAWQGENVVLNWAYPNDPNPNPNPNPVTVSYDFEDGLSGWTTIDADGDGENWDNLSDNVVSWMTAHSGHAVASSFSWNGVPLNPDNYMVSPEVAGATKVIYFVSTNTGYPDHYAVMASSTGTNAGDFTTVFEEDVPVAKGGSGIKNQVNVAGPREQSSWTERSVDLPAGTKYVAFRHFNCPDMNYILVDDVVIESGAKGGRAMWDLVKNFNLNGAGEQGVATDGNFIYTSSWSGYPGYDFGKYDMNGNFVEGFSIGGASGIRDLTYDGTFFYGGAGASTLYKLDLANKALVGTVNCSGKQIRHCSYDPSRDGFWVGNWDDLCLVDRTGATVQTAPAPSSAYGSGYYKDADNVEHLYLFCQPNSDAKVYDYNITTNTLNPTPVFDFSITPGFNGGVSGGAFVGVYDGKTCFFGNSQQEPNLVGIYELGAGSTPPVPPIPTGDILGAVIFRDGEYLGFTADTTYTDMAPEAVDHEYCVRVVYNGDTLLPNNNIYYSMSCPDCVTVPSTTACEPGAPITGVYKWVSDNDFGSLISWGENINPIAEWLYYDNGTYATSIGFGDGGGVIYWGSMFPAASLTGYAGTNLTKVALFENEYNISPVTVNIYLGGTTAPGTLVSTQNFTPVGGEAFHEVTLTTPVGIDGTQNLWITFNENGTYPANACDDTGEANNRWVSENGSEWADLASAGLPGYGWMIRGFVTNSRGGMVENIALEPAPTAASTATGMLGHTEVVNKPADLSFMNRAEIVEYNVYRSTDNTNYSAIGTVPAVAGQTYYEYYDAVNMIGEYYYQVKAVYDNGCESEPAPSAINPDEKYVKVNVTSIGQYDSEVNLYPNPTSGNVTIQAAGMNRITVVSTLGQVVYDAEIENDMTTLNMGQFTAGIYTVRIATATGMSVKRVTVVK